MNYSWLHIFSIYLLFYSTYLFLILLIKFTVVDNDSKEDKENSSQSKFEFSKRDPHEWTKEDDEKLLKIIQKYPKKVIVNSQMILKDKTINQITKRIAYLKKSLNENNKQIENDIQFEFKEDSLIEENRENYSRKLRRRNKIGILRTEIDDSFLYYKTGAESPKKSSKKNLATKGNAKKDTVFSKFRKMISKKMPYPVMRWFYCPIKYEKEEASLYIHKEEAWLPEKIENKLEIKL